MPPRVAPTSTGRVTPTEATQIVTTLVKTTGHTEVIKVKSMATQEIGLVKALENAGITAHETDLAEMIIQLSHDRPSHIVVPALHRNRAEIRLDLPRTHAGCTKRPDR